MKTKTMREKIRTLLLTTGCNDVSVPPRTNTDNYPYITFEIHELSSAYGTNLGQLEVNCVGKGLSADIDELADEVQELLHEYFYNDQTIWFRLFKSNRNIVIEEDLEIIRRRLLFDLYFHE